MIPPIVLPAIAVVLLETAEGSGVPDVVTVELFSFGMVLACVVVTVGSGVVAEISDGCKSAVSSVHMRYMMKFISNNYNNREHLLT